MTTADQVHAVANMLPTAAVVLVAFLAVCAWVGRDDA